MSDSGRVADTSRVVGGIVDLLSRSMVARLTGLLSSVALARLLTPGDFGRAAVAISLVNVAVFFLDSGMTAAALRLPEEPTAALLRAMSGLQLLVAVVAVCVIVPIASLGERPSLTIVALALLPLLALQTPMLIVAERRLDFSNISNAELVASLVSQGLSVVLAFAGAGVWSLVVGTVVRPLVSAVWMAPTVDRAVLLPTWRLAPAFALLRDALRLQVMPASMVLRDQGSTLIAAAVVGASALGTWVLVGRLLSVAAAVYGVLGRVAYPAAAARNREDGIPADQVERAIARIAFASAWLLGLTCAGSLYAVPVVFGAEWGAAVPALLVTCVGGLVGSAITTPTISLLMVRRQVLGPVIGVVLHAAVAWLMLCFGPIRDSAMAIGVATSLGALAESAVLVALLGRIGMSWRSTALIPMPALGVGVAAVAAGAAAGATFGPAVAMVLSPLAAVTVLLLGSVTVLRREWTFVREQLSQRRRRG